jgi:predicted PurR-regulated permease PerM
MMRGASVRTTVLAILAVLAVLAALRIAAGVIIPVVVSILTAFALDPIVRGFERLKLPRWLAAAVTVVGILGLLAGAGWMWSDEVIAATERLPEATERLRRELSELRAKPPKPIDALQEAAADIEAGVTQAAGAAPARAKQEAVSLGLRDWLLGSSMTIIGFGGQLILLIFLVYFLLASGDLFRRKLVRIAGPALSQRKITVDVLNGISHSIQHFILSMLLSNLVVTVLSYAAFRALDFAHPGLWALFGGALNTIPYVGSAVVTVILLIVALLQFGSLEPALLVSGAYLVISTAEGFLLMPFLVSRGGRMNNVAIFLGLLFWGWLWGAWGMLLAYPIMMVIKTVADRVEELKPLGELLGE